MGTDKSDEIQDINNQACVHIAFGNYSKANLLLTWALRKHAERNCDNEFDECCDDDFSMLDVDTDVDEGDNDHDDNDYMINTNNDTINDPGSKGSSSNNNQQRHRLHEQETIHIPSCDEPYHDTAAKNPLRRMTTNSHLRTIPYCGQHQRQQDDYNHQVYCLPMAMSEAEWNMSSSVDHSFVLIFNMALCYHLWGMDLIASSERRRQQEQQQQRWGNNDRYYEQQEHMFAQQLFQEAKKMYLLAAGGHHGDLHVLDKFCYPAIFNNMSHVCKSLDGYNSYEAYRYDTLLLRSVRLLIDSAANTTSTPTSSSANNYYENDSDIIDSFMENVFYLHGAPETAASAA